MDNQTVLVFTRSGLGDTPAKLQSLLAQKFLGLLEDASLLPGKIVLVNSQSDQPVNT